MSRAVAVNTSGVRAPPINGNDGSYNLTVSFELGTNPDINTVNVNNRVQTAMAELPASVTQQGLTIQKRSSAILEFVNLYSDGAKQDPLFITNYATINVIDEISAGYPASVRPICSVS